MPASVDARRCLHCGGCVVACPAQASSFRDPELVIDGERCTSCGACVRVCPAGALSLG